MGLGRVAKDAQSMNLSCHSAQESSVLWMHDSHLPVVLCLIFFGRLPQVSMLSQAST